MMMIRTGDAASTTWKSLTMRVEGPWGSAVLMTNLHIWSQPVAVLGAFTIVVALAMEPSVQLLIVIPMRPYPRFDGVAQSTAPWVQTFDDAVSWGGGDSEVQDVASPTIETTLNAAIYATDVETQFGFDVVCPTEYCEFTEFESLGYCHTCEDMTEAAVLEGCDLTLTWDHWREVWHGVADGSRTLNNTCRVYFNLSGDYSYDITFQKDFQLNYTLDSVNQAYYEGDQDPLGIGKGGWDIMATKHPKLSIPNNLDHQPSLDMVLRWSL
ncbi:hypothetical protein F4778DRAFT_500736 [Xylariomycetidae sp. FL2044]|nr:hypothetical protein F4778DRAFT_500736 [Xylariomycetidae sp. FL2044]